MCPSLLLSSGERLITTSTKIGSVLLLALVLGICASVPAFGGTPLDPPADPAATVTASSTTTSQPAPPVPVPPLAVAPQPALHVLQVGALRQTKKEIIAYRRLAWHWQGLMGLHRTPFGVLALRTHSPAYANWALKHQKDVTGHLHNQAKHWMVKRTSALLAQIRTWSKMLGVSWYDRRLFGMMNIEQRYTQAQRWYYNYKQRYNPEFLIGAFSCIHHYEGAWTANTGNGYYGGLQMDRPFQSRYGGSFLRRWGTANNWPIWAQIQASVRAYRSGRGFGPWPNTAHDCGLL